MGGAIARVAADTTAFGDRSAPWAIWVASQWTDPAEDAVHREWTRSFSESVDRWKTGAVYVNAIGGDVTSERKLAAYGGPAKYERLRELKRTWDPDNLFHLNHNVAP
jgi:FAD/FMN-containing dehydrogenase